MTVAVMRSASGNLVSAETTTPVPVDGYESAVVRLDITTLTIGASEEVDFYFQTTYNNADWVDVFNVHYAQADTGNTPKTLYSVGAPVLGTVIVITPVVETDGTLTDDLLNLLPLGVSVRWKTLLTNGGIYAYNSEIFLK